jgi:hypothetical protein
MFKENPLALWVLHKIKSIQIQAIKLSLKRQAMEYIDAISNCQNVQWSRDYWQFTGVALRESYCVFLGFCPH